MKKFFNKFLGFGMILLAIDAIICLLLKDIKLLPVITGIASAPFFFISALMIGAFAGPESRQIDLYIESSDSLRRRVTWSTNFLLIALPSLIVCIVSFILIFYRKAYF